MQPSYPKKIASYTRAFGQDYSRPCFSAIVNDSDEERNFRSQHSDKDIKTLPLAEMTAGAIMALIVIKKHGLPIKMPYLMRHFFGAYDNKMDPHIDVLKERGFIKYADDHFSITKQGESYLDEYNCTGVEDIKKKGFQYAILKFLYNSNGMVKIDYFPKFLIDSCPHITQGYKELDLIQYLGYTDEMRPFIQEKNHFYSLSLAGRKLYDIENQQEMKQRPIFELNLLDLGLQIEARKQELIRGGILASSPKEANLETEKQDQKEALRETETRSATVEHHYHAPVTQTSIVGNSGPIVQDSIIQGSQLSDTSSGCNADTPKVSKHSSKILKMIGGITAVSGALLGLIKLIAYFLHLQHHP